jgi:hypothetical protein
MIYVASIYQKKIQGRWMGSKVYALSLAFSPTRVVASLKVFIPTTTYTVWRHDILMTSFQNISSKYFPDSKMYNPIYIYIYIYIYMDNIIIKDTVVLKYEKKIYAYSKH